MSEDKQNAAKTKTKSENSTGTMQKKTRITIIVSAIVLVAVGAIAGVAIYRNRVAPFKTVIVAVDETDFDMRYFLKRLAMSGEDSFSLLSTLSEEAMLRIQAPKPPYNINVTEDDIDLYGKDLAKGTADSIDENEYREWYRQRLNESSLSEAEFRELLKTSILAKRMSEYLGENLPTVAEHIYLNMIPVEEFNIGQEVKAKFDKGEDFADLAREYSSDSRLAENGGKVGWFPQGAMDKYLGKTAFDLEVGECSDPIMLTGSSPDQETTVVIMVSDRVAEREIDENAMQAMKSGALDDWYTSEFKNHKVSFHGLNNPTGYDSKTDAWVHWQLARMKRNEEKQNQDQGQAQGQNPATATSAPLQTGQ